MLAGSQSADAVRSGWGCLACRPPLPYGRVRISSRWPFGSSKYTPRVIPVVDPARVLPGGIRPVRSVAAAEPLEDLVEFLLADQERVVQLVDVPVHGDEVERRVRLTWRTANSPRWVGGSKPRVSAKPRRRLVVPGPNDVVVQHGHGNSLVSTASSDLGLTRVCLRVPALARGHRSTLRPATRAALVRVWRRRALWRVQARRRPRRRHRRERHRGAGGLLAHGQPMAPNWVRRPARSR
jgi:hypothetical protein